MSSPALPHIITLESGATIIIAPIESYDTPSPQDASYKRHCERASWHAAARTILNDPSAQFDYNALGAPIIVGSELKIGVSHSSSLVAVIISHTHCAIDIESLDRNFKKIASRYITPDEAALSNSEQLLPKLWSIKETLYKYSRMSELSLLDDLRVTAIDGENFCATISPHDKEIQVVVTTLFDHTLAYIG